MICNSQKIRRGAGRPRRFCDVDVTDLGLEISTFELGIVLISRRGMYFGVKEEAVAEVG